MFERDINSLVISIKVDGVRLLKRKKAQDWSLVALHMKKALERTLVAIRHKNTSWLSGTETIPKHIPKYPPSISKNNRIWSIVLVLVLVLYSIKGSC